MQHVVFVAPVLMEATLRFAGAVAAVEDTRVVLLTQDPLRKVPDPLRRLLAGHWRVDDALSADRIVAAVGQIAAASGPVDRLLGTLEQLQVPLAAARARLGIAGLSEEAAENFRDKARMKTVLARHGIGCARHCLVADVEGAKRFAREVGYPLVLKPPAGAGAKATFRVRNEEELARTLASMGPAPGRTALVEKAVLVEEFVQGEEHSFDTVTIAGRPVWHSLSHYRPSPLTVLENPWIQWCVLVPREIDEPQYDDIRKEAFRALAALGMGTGVSHMEWFRRPDGTIAISEVAARPPGAQFCTLISHAHGIDFYRAWAHLVVKDRFALPERRFAAGAAYLRGQGPGSVQRVRGLVEVQRELGSLVVEARVPRFGQGSSGSYEGEGWIVVRHPRTDVVARALERIVELVRVEMG